MVFLSWDLADTGDAHLACVLIHISVGIVAAVVGKLQEACCNIATTSGWMCGMLGNFIIEVTVNCEHKRSTTNIVVLRTVAESEYQASCCADNNIICFLITGTIKSSSMAAKGFHWR